MFSQQARQRDHGYADRAEGYRCGVGQKANSGGKKRREPKPRQHRRRHGDRCAEARRALDEGPEREGNEHGLQATIGRQPADRVFDDLEITRLER